MRPRTTASANSKAIARSRAWQISLRSISEAGSGSYHDPITSTSKNTQQPKSIKPRKTHPREASKAATN
ncbi:unnamed protein product [Dovyalis caffra]|uniref:Uncharacterized protein n=1 Tax=Dovyalis caffra TaxID=77055 RepID=A0AAV1RTA4_9ROSI|nr:unnamed protein product [Dovyalis caffra]